jgi:hypothetical protein
MPDPEIRLTLRQVDQARTDFAIIEHELEIYPRLARIPTRVELARTALAIIFGTAGLVILFELLWRCAL